MALKYWENLIDRAHLKARGQRDLYNQTYVHEFQLDTKWTYDAIKAFMHDEEPNFDPAPADINKFVDFFHRTISKSRVKKNITDRDFKAGAYYANLKSDMTGSKRQQGVILEATYYNLVTNPGNTGLNRIADVRQQTEKRIRKFLKNKIGHNSPKVGGNKYKNYLGDHLQFAHGEGINTPNTTVSGISLAHTALDDMNSRKAGNDLLKRGILQPGLIQKASVTALKDLLYTDFEIDINLDASTRGDKCSFKDEFTIYGAMKIQDEHFASRYDMDSSTKSGVGKRYLEAVKGALNKELSKGMITKGDYESSPKGKKRMKAQTTKQVVTSMKKKLKSTPGMVVLGHDALADYKKKTRKSVKTKKTKPKVGKQTGTRAKTKNRRTKVAAGPNPIALKELINAALPKEILERMNPPALRNRTGRFRRSAQVTNVLVGPRGGVEAEYTYMKMPYQTFEPGYAQGSTYRDPRKIIGESVREIAQKLTGNRFIKVRRT